MTRTLPRLDEWIPRLLEVYRRVNKLGAGPERSLRPEELRQAASAVRALSRGLTRERELAGARYMDDPALVAGYLLFYWPVSYAQARSLLGELPPGRLRRALDLGSGPGPGAFAAIDAGVAEVTAADRSPAALALARELAIEAGQALSMRQWSATGGAPLPEGRFELITMSHLLNELWPAAPDRTERRVGFLERVLQSLSPEGTLVIVEPALRDTSRALLQVRDRLVASGHALHAPCLFGGPCPALTAPSDWCHAEREWEPPALVQTIARAAGLHKEALKMSYLIVKGGSARGASEERALDGAITPDTPEQFRIVSEPLASKGRLRYMGCGPRGRVGLSLQQKHLTKENQAFERLARGDLIALTSARQQGDGLALEPTCQVSLLARAGAPPPKH